MTDWVERFMGLSRLSADLKTRLMADSALVQFAKGAVVFGPDISPQNMLFLLDGTIRVQQVSETGREIVLYRIQAGESCVLTTACLLAFENYAAEGIAETPVRTAAVPRQLFDDLVAGSKEFRNFVFAAFSKRITDLFLVIDEVAFQRMDIRLAQRLLELAKDSPSISVTHQQLAVELGTAREVVSRQLQEFQRRGWIALRRGVVEIQNPRGLSALTA
jgi:CRP/FNR family transcriptional regulator